MRSARLMFVGSAFLACATAAHAGNLLLNPSFEAPVVASAWAQILPGQAIGAWTCDDLGQGVVLVSSFGNPSTPYGQQSVELNFYVSGGVHQTVPTVAGKRYRLSFFMAGQYGQGPDIKPMQVKFGGQPVATVEWSRSGSGGQWEFHSLEVTATADTSVVDFIGLVNVDGGPYLDNVSLIPLCAPDLNGDGVIDDVDFVLFAQNYDLFSVPPASGACDFNDDAQIDDVDFVIFASAYDQYVCAE